MLSLPELSETYKNSHPHYINPLAYFDVTDRELANLKREALFPYLENLEEKMVIYRARLVAFVVLFGVECDERGFRANVWRLNIIHLPEYAKRLAEHKIWQVACTWNSIRLLDDRINCSPLVGPSGPRTGSLITSKRNMSTKEQPQRTMLWLKRLVCKIYLIAKIFCKSRFFRFSEF